MRANCAISFGGGGCEAFHSPIDLEGVGVDDLDRPELTGQFQCHGALSAPGLAGEVERLSENLHALKENAGTTGSRSGAFERIMRKKSRLFRKSRFFLCIVVGTIATSTADDELPAHKVLIIKNAHRSFRLIG